MEILPFLLDDVKVQQGVVIVSLWLTWPKKLAKLCRIRISIFTGSLSVRFGLGVHS